MPTPTSPHSYHALRVAIACTGCLLVVVWIHLEHANLAVWTTYMVMAQYPVTVFQKGLERTLGRGVGILAAIVLIGLFPDSPFPRLTLECIGILVLFYVYFAGRFSYAFLNAGLYLGVLVEIGRTDPEAVVPQGWGMFLAVLLGSLMADVVVWFSAAERDLHLDPGTQPLFPLRTDWLVHAVMMMVTVFSTILTCRLLELPIAKAIVSVMILTAAPDLQGVLLKGKLRLGGAMLGAAWGLGSFLILSRLPYLSLLAVLLFLGLFVAAYLTRILGAKSYLGLQMGLVIPLVLVVPPDEFGSLGGVMQRIEGVLIALACTLVVAGLWPRFPLRSAPG